MGLNLFEKIWNQHLITQINDTTDLIYIDRIFLHERTGSIALNSIKESNRTIKRPENVYCVVDHIVDTTKGRSEFGLVEGSHLYIQSFRKLALSFNLTFFDIDHRDQGISHVVAAEQGIAVPGLISICPDSHTCTLGGMSALGIGIGTSQAELALITGTLKLARPKALRVTINGKLHPACSAKDIALALIRKYGTYGGNGHVVEFSGEVVDQMEVEGRMTLCNLAVEFGAFSGIIGCDSKTKQYFLSTDYGKNLDSSETLAYLDSLHSDDSAKFDTELELDITDMFPQISWGITPAQTIGINEMTPKKNSENKAAYDYIELEELSKISGTPFDCAFIGSCTNSRISDLRQAAKFLKNKKIDSSIRAIVVPGSTRVKKLAEEEGLDKIFLDAGFEWRESGCSLCFFAGGEEFGIGKRVVSSTNRNFKNRQGTRVKTHITSPLIVAVSAVIGHIPTEDELNTALGLV